MNKRKYNWLLYFITATIFVTVIVQLYWNYKNYEVNKQNFINQIQTSFDNAIESYYAALAESNELTLFDIPGDSIRHTIFRDSTSFRHDNDSIFFEFHSDSIFLHGEKDSVFSHYERQYADIFNKKIIRMTQVMDSNYAINISNANELTKVKMFRGKKASDSLKLIRGINAIYVSILDDTLNFSKLTPLVHQEFQRKSFEIPFAMTHLKNGKVTNTYNLDIITPEYLSTASTSTYFKQNESLQLSYPNATKYILKQSLAGILLSLLLSIFIISCLIYLLRIIQNQKQLAEIKNDLISNITHEFKTPIATIGVALESIQHFDGLSDKEKTKTYLNISTNQLKKLNTMVEKLLETASLDSDQLELKSENTDLVSLIRNCIGKHQLISKKEISFSTSSPILRRDIDVFHFENAINNILDNAIKYGGDTITITIHQSKNELIIQIKDNGNSLDKSSTSKIFQQFYRVPQGNTHNVKGFGIGLYYTKKIIEKHQGTIVLLLENKETNFKIVLPYGSSD